MLAFCVILGLIMLIILAAAPLVLPFVTLGFCVYGLSHRNFNIWQEDKFFPRGFAWWKKLISIIVAFATCIVMGVVLRYAVGEIGQKEELTVDTYKLYAMEDNQAWVLHGNRYHTDGRSYLTYYYTVDYGTYRQDFDTGECSVKKFDTKETPVVKIYTHQPVKIYSPISQWYWSWGDSLGWHQGIVYKSYDFYIPPGSDKQKFNSDLQ